MMLTFLRHSCLPLLLSLPTVLRAAPSEDEILSLPGLDQQPSFKQYSGYLSGSGTRRLHYWFVESTQVPQTDPLAVWLNGGPGCSSLFGLLSENGPFRVEEDGKKLTYNPFSWNTVANVLYIESPAGVGFSYSLDKNYTTDDDLTADENFSAMKDFFRKFPEYRTNDLFITGESYGGIYVPMLANRLLSDSSFNLKGYAVGNGVSSHEYLGDSIVYFAYYHGLMGTEQWTNLLKTCCNGDANNCQFIAASQKSSACYLQVRKVNDIIHGGAFDAYNLYAPCAGGVGISRAHSRLVDWALSFVSGSKKMSGVTAKNYSANPSCTDETAITTYANLPDVRQALHIPDDVQQWQDCVEYGIGWYTQIYNNTTPFYNTLFQAGIRGVIYNGDVDMVCNFLGDEWFADSLGRPLKEARKMWFYNDDKGLKQVAGFVKTFDLLTYVTVRGSGHMVPMDRPRPALVLFTIFIQNKPF